MSNSAYVDFCIELRSTTTNRIVELDEKIKIMSAPNSEGMYRYSVNWYEKMLLTNILLYRATTSRLVTHGVLNASQSDSETMELFRSVGKPS